ncbi:MAG: phosphoribosylglycinamide formyltransferase [Flavobacteriaceae bacterium]|nr:phosphoribosylglycinamide formyltransferase [Flavobacteriaceae bacterium]
MIRIVIFASGSGTNAENIIRYFDDSNKIKIIAVLSNKKGAKVLERANKYNIKTKVFSHKEFYETEKILEYLKKEADFIVLAGFLWKVPEKIIEVFSNKIINIHPALLPNYGGKGMYGMHIHKAIVTNRESKTGITIHYVNKNYDEGAVIFQKEVALSNTDTPESVAKKVHLLEQDNFPKIIEKVLINKN